MNPTLDQNDSAESRSILVVDDDPLVLRMTEIVLDGLGFRVLSAATGARALEVIEELGDGIDLVVLDLRLPDMDGMHVLREAHAKHPGLRVLAVTGYASDEVVSSFDEAGAVGTLEKPYDVDTLVAAVRGALA